MPEYPARVSRKGSLAGHGSRHPLEGRARLVQGIHAVHFGHGGGEPVARRCDVVRDGAALRAREIGRLVHVDPQAAHSLVHGARDERAQNERTAGELGSRGTPPLRPHGPHERVTVLVFQEMTNCPRPACTRPTPGRPSRRGPRSPRCETPCPRATVRGAAGSGNDGIPGEGAESIHVLDVEPHRVRRDLPGAQLVRDREHLGVRRISPLLDWW